MTSPEVDSRAQAVAGKKEEVNGQKVPAQWSEEVPRSPTHNLCLHHYPGHLKWPPRRNAGKCRVLKLGTQLIPLKFG